jgi:transcriptional regulator with XRE-family HTH domain
MSGTHYNGMPYVPAPRVVAILDEYRARTQASDRDLARETGISERAFYAWRSGERASVRFDLVDTLLTRIDRTDLWHTELADVYESSIPSTRPGERVSETGERVYSAAWL